MVLELIKTNKINI